MYVNRDTDRRKYFKETIFCHRFSASHFNLTFWIEVYVSVGEFLAAVNLL